MADSAADSTWVPNLAATAPATEGAVTTNTPRHSALVRITHWVTTLCFFALLITGIEILISHPRFYWGEAGNVNTPSLFKLPIPASRSSVPTGYSFRLPDQNGWSRYLHFQAAWIVVLTGLLYAAYGIFARHFRKNVIPSGTDLSWRSLSGSIALHLRPKPPGSTEASSYNVLQRITYSFVIFILFPLVIWTGLAMSPAIASAFPFTVTAFGGQQSARTIHFFVSIFLTIFLVVHVVMVCRTGFTNLMRGMITGRTNAKKENV